LNRVFKDLLLLLLSGRRVLLHKYRLRKHHLRRLDIQFHQDFCRDFLAVFRHISRSPDMIFVNLNFLKLIFDGRKTKKKVLEVKVLA
jgi:hypothetical protein